MFFLLQSQFFSESEMNTIMKFVGVLKIKFLIFMDIMCCILQLMCRLTSVSCVVWLATKIYAHTVRDRVRVHTIHTVVVLQSLWTVVNEFACGCKNVLLTRSETYNTCFIATKTLFFSYVLFINKRQGYVSTHWGFREKTLENSMKLGVWFQLIVSKNVFGSSKIVSNKPVGKRLDLFILKYF